MVGLPLKEQQQKSLSLWKRFITFPARSLSAKVLLLTVLFVMIAEILIFVPSVANFRKTWLFERLGAAQIASVAAEQSSLPEKLVQKLLINARVHAVAIKSKGQRKLVLSLKDTPRDMGYYPLSHASLIWDLIPDAISAFFSNEDRLIRVSGNPDMVGGSLVEIVVSEAALIKDMHTYALNILALSLLVSSIAAILIFFALNRILIWPMQNITNDIVSFSQNPEDPNRLITLSGRRDEVGKTERSLLSLEKELAEMLKQKSRLASLGLAVSKINHDLRNMLASAQLISDHLGTVDNPTVQRMTPRLITSLDRAIRLCGNTLKYGKTTEITPERRPFPLLPLVNEVLESLGCEQKGILFNKDIQTDLVINADRDQIFRVISNLTRNAALALKAEQESGTAPNKQPTISIQTRKEEGQSLIVVEDNGPGIPEKLRDSLFMAFHSSGQEGTGLGLAISDELVRAHGGTIELKQDSRMTCFIISLPD